MDSSKNNTVPSWQTLHSGELSDWNVMQLQSVERKHPFDGRQSNFTVAHAPGWVNILPITSTGDVVLVEQYRHGTNRVTLEIPGGVLHPGEDPQAAAERECLEETGYGSQQPSELLGVVEPNSAFMANTCSMYLWHGCEQISTQELDPLEDIRVRLVTIKNFLDMVRNGTINHALVLSAVTLAMVNGTLVPQAEKRG